MKIDVLFASLPVRDLEAVRPWYERLFGRPPDIIPNETEVMWKASDSGWVYLIRDAGRAGHGVVTMAVPDLDTARSAVAARGVEVGPIEPVDSAGRKAVVLDPEGNSIALIEVPGAH